MFKKLIIINKNYLKFPQILFFVLHFIFNFFIHIDDDRSDCMTTFFNMSYFREELVNFNNLEYYILRFEPTCV